MQITHIFLTYQIKMCDSESLDGIYINRINMKRRRGYAMPTSKKQLVKLNKAKKEKAEDLAKQAAAGSESAKKKLKKLEKKIR